jgi:hypothetical protein
MQSRAIESRAAEKFARVHAEMYIKGSIPSGGGSSGVLDGRSRSSSSISRANDKG